MNKSRKEYHNETAGQIAEKARDLNTMYFTDDYVFWLENKINKTEYICKDESKTKAIHYLKKGVNVI